MFIRGRKWWRSKSAILTGRTLIDQILIHSSSPTLIQTLGEKMEIISRPFNGENYWKKKGYSLLNGATVPRRKIKVVQVAGGGVGEERRRRKRLWRLRKAPKLMTPKSMWRKFKEGYVKFMLSLSGDVDGESGFTAKRITSAGKLRLPSAKHDATDFERRLVLEIYKSLATSRGVSEF